MSTNANRPVRRRKVVSHYSDDNPSTFTKKMKGDDQVPSRGRPPESSRRKKSPPSHSRKRKSPPNLPPPADDMTISHARTINPVFPLQELFTDAADTTVSNSTQSVFLGAGSNQPPPDPTWTHLSSHVQEYDPIGSITWLSIRQDREDYAVVGDCRGAVALMRNAATITVIRTTSAAKRDQEREISKRKVFPNAISQCAWADDVIAVLTKTELECLSVATKSILWSMPIVVDPRKSCIQTPVLSLQKKSLLWTTGQWGLESEANGSLLLWESVQTTTDHTPTVLTLKSVPNMRYLTALWKKSDSSRSFFCVAQTNDEIIELLHCQYVQTDIVVQHRQPLPVFGRNNIAECTLQQFDEFIFVSGRGIRMYNASNLTFVASYGENVQLHGKVVIWSRCCWLPAPYTQQSNIRLSKKNYWIEQSDVLADSGKVHDSRQYWLMGIPHPFKGPEELKSNLYLWQKNGVGSFLKSIPKGCTSDVWVNRNTWNTVAVSAETGNLKELADSTKSSFAGVMYPVGFNVITENIEYIEDEDELDQVLPDRDKPMLGLYDEDPILHDDDSPQKLDSGNLKPIFIDVNSGRDVVEDANHVICWPEADRLDHDEADPGSPKRNDRRYPVLPQIDQARQEMAGFVAEEPEPVKTKLAPGRKRLEVLKQSSIDCHLQNNMIIRRGQWSDSNGSSLDPVQLKHSPEEKTLAMELLFLSPGQKRQYIDDSKEDEVDTKDELSCPACLGRMTLHKCRKREMPIDYDALAREELARRQREEAEKMRIKTERRKQAELKRREAKKRKKMEEERQRNEQLQADLAMKQNILHGNEEFSAILESRPLEHSTIPSPFPTTLKIDGNEVVPSTSLNPTDALSALAGLADSLSAQPDADLANVRFRSSKDFYQGGDLTQECRDSHNEKLDATFTILPEPKDEGKTEVRSTEPQSSYIPTSAHTGTQPESRSNMSPEASLVETSVSEPDTTSDILVPSSTANSIDDITFHTVPGSTLPIMSDANFRKSFEGANSNGTSPLISPAICATAGVLTPTGLSAIAMLSETAARQAIREGEEKGLISATQLNPEQLNGQRQDITGANGLTSYQLPGDDGKLVNSCVDVQADSHA